MRVSWVFGHQQKASDDRGTAKMADAAQCTFRR